VGVAIAGHPNAAKIEANMGKERFLEPAGSPGAIASDKREQGVLFASGLIAGAALVGVAIGGLIYTVTQVTGDPTAADRWIVGEEWTHLFPYSSELIGTAIFAGLCWLLWRAANRRIEA
jgi:hypothetical protein